MTAYMTAALIFLMVVNIVTLICVAFLAISQERIIERSIAIAKATNAAVSRVNVVSKFAHRHNVKKSG